MNIVLDVICIISFGMGVEGAAYATVFSQFVAALGSGTYMWKKYAVLHMTKEERRADLKSMGTLLYMGLPMGLQYSITAIGTVFMQIAVNGLGSVSVAAVTAGIRIDSFFFAIFDALGATMATFGGQNVGARKLERVKKGLGCACIIGSVYSIFAFAILNLSSPKLALLFVDASETALIANVVKYTMFESLFFIPLALVNCVRYMIQGMGFSMFAFCAGIMELIARSSVALILVPMLGFTGACLAGPVAWVMADIYLIPAFFHVYHLLQKRFEAQKDTGVFAEA